MPTQTGNSKKKTAYVRKEEPGFLENLGVNYYRHLAKKSGTAGLRNLTIIELAVLYWLGLKTVYSLACLTGHNQASEGSCLQVDDAVPNIFARAALEVPDPVIHYLGIDPLKHLSRTKLFLVAALYKAKVILSSMTVKYKQYLRN